MSAHPGLTIWIMVTFMLWLVGFGIAPRGGASGGMGVALVCVASASTVALFFYGLTLYVTAVFRLLL